MRTSPGGGGGGQVFGGGGGGGGGVLVWGGGGGRAETNWIVPSLIPVLHFTLLTLPPFSHILRRRPHNFCDSTEQ